MAEHDLPKVETAVRFRSPAQKISQFYFRTRLRRRFNSGIPLIIDFFNFLCYNVSKKAEKAGFTLLNKR